ncbi:MAG: LptF/LptG family permease [Candidatus Omnitrophota bacterium]|nr:MAG: LptF/LptG family permease [Candidatus Omnitrophota bacterium]
MRILDRLLFKTIFRSYIFILAVFIGLYFIIDIFTNLSDFFQTKPPLKVLTEYYLLMLPLIFLRVSPLAILISVLYSFGEFNKNNEILSMRSSGISRLRISTPIIIFTVFLSFFSLFLQEKILANSQKRVEEIKMKFIQKSFSLVKEETNIAFTSGNMIFFVGKFLPKKGILQNAIIFKEDANRNIEKKISCKELTYENGKWQGRDISEYRLDSKGNILGIPRHYATKEIPIEEKPQEIILKKSIFAQFASLKSLRREMKRLKKIKAKNLLSNLTIDYHKKLADPFSHFFLIIGILPLALEIKKRKVALSSLGVGFIFGFVYYAFSSFSIALGKAGIILPIFSAWLAPLFFLSVGLSGLSLIR